MSDQRRYVELLPNREGMALTEAERADWESEFARWREAEAAGAPNGRCAEALHAEGVPSCSAAMVPATTTGTYCVPCLWCSVRDYGSDG